MATLRNFDGAPALAPRAFNVQSAARETLWIKAGIDGPSGSGKTLGGLLMAYGLAQSVMPEATPEEIWKRVAVVDTENRSALYYKGRNIQGAEGDVRIGMFRHVAFDPPYDPRYWLQVIDTLEDAGIVAALLDSTTHEWTGQGGCLDMQRSIGGRAQDWAIVSPIHQAFIDRIRLANLHMICAMRSKQEYAITTADDGSGKKKTTVEKLGMKPEQREGFEYELGVVFTVEHATHQARCGKDRTGLFAGQSPFLITPETGRTIGDWCKGGVSAIGSEEWLAQRLTDIREIGTMVALETIFKKTVRQGAALLTAKDKEALVRAKDEAKARIAAATKK